MPGLGFLKLQKNPLRSIPTGVIFISSPRVNLISTKRVTFSRRQGSICTDFSTNGIESVFERDDHVHIRVYTPAGFCIYEGAADEASLSPGIYIVITADRVEKVVIK